MSDDSQSELPSAPSDIASDDAVPLTAATSTQEAGQESVVKPVAAAGTNGISRKRRAEESGTSIARTKRARRGPKPVYKEEEETEEVQQAVVPSPRERSRRDRGPTRAAVIQKTELTAQLEADFEAAANGTVKKSRRKTKTKTRTEVSSEAEIHAEDLQAEGDTVTKKVKRKRKTKEEKEAEAMPLAARTVGSKILIGAHVSSAGGVHNAVTNCVHIGGNAFALFLKSQRKWANPPLQTEHSDLFRSHCTTHAFDGTQHVVPHGSYLVNLAHVEPDRAKQAYEAFVDDLRRCRSLGIKLYNFHPGNCASASNRDEGIAQLARQLNRAHKDAGAEGVVTLLETMAAGGNVLGSSFEDLKAVIDLVERKERVGVCLDTCHVFAAGYDLRSPEAFRATMNKFNDVVGLKYLRALHVNDSKAPFASNRDLHANIGTGFLGLRAFHNVVNEPRLWGLPMVLETPIDAKNAQGKEEQDKRIWAQEIKLLESLVGMDVEGDGFVRLEAELAVKGEEEKKKYQEQFERKMEKRREKEAKKNRGTRKRRGGGVDAGQNSSSGLSSSSESSDEDR